MRRLLIGLVVAVTTAIVPCLALAGNQEVADQIAKNLRNSGQLTNDYKISVKFQDGTAFLRGTVTSPEQVNAALMVVYQTPGVTRVVNEITTAPAAERAQAVPLAMHRTDVAPSQVNNPLRKEDAQRLAKPSMVQRLQSAIGIGEKSAEGDVAASAQPVASSFTANPVEQASAEENVAKPHEVVPQSARPMAAQQRVAMQPNMMPQGAAANGAPLPMYSAAAPSGVAPARYDQARLPNYAWPSYAAYPNYAAVTYPKQYSPTVWPYIGPFYPYPQVPLGWRKVSLEWSDGWWFLDFKDQPASAWQR